MAIRKPVPQAFSEAEYNAITTAFQFVERATSQPDASVFDLSGGAELRAHYRDLLPKLGLATYGESE